MAREEHMRQMNNYMLLFRKRDTDQQFENAITQVHELEILNPYPSPEDDDDVDETHNTRMNDDQFQQAQTAMKAVQKEVFRFVTLNVHEQNNDR